MHVSFMHNTCDAIPEIHFSKTWLFMLHRFTPLYSWWQYVATIVICFALQGFALSSIGTSSKNNVFVITHAAGRMGKLLALQMRENAQKTESELPCIRAIVRSDAEAMSVKCDLGGMTIKEGKVAPIKLDWLETIVVENIHQTSDQAKLHAAFQGAKAAILCDASHNEMVWSRVNGDDVCSVVVPAADSKDLSDRLLVEIDAAACSSTLKHVVMRSSMGLALGEASEGGIAMGGKAALDGPRKAEKALKSSSLDYTILRLGALTDNAGMVPLVFGTDDSLLEKRVDSTNTRRPPIISRADAARASIFLLNESTYFKGMTIDCSWHPTFGSSSVGTEEAMKAAARQDLKKEIFQRCTFQKSK